jgi:hypothetical protein
MESRCAVTRMRSSDTSSEPPGTAQRPVGLGLRWAQLALRRLEQLALLGEFCGVEA